MPDIVSPDNDRTKSNSIPRLARRQRALVYELAQGHDIATVAARRGRGVSSTYELAGRVCSRLGLSQWEEIGPYAIEHGLLDRYGPEGDSRSQKR